MLKKEREQIELKESYPWLDSSDERKCMTDREILDKYIDLNSSCQTKEEKKEVMEILYKYKETFSLRDELGTCPNIEVEIDVMDKSPFFIRPYNIKEEDKTCIFHQRSRRFPLCIPHHSLGHHIGTSRWHHFG